MTVSRQDIVPWIAPVCLMAVVSITLSLSVPLFALLLERTGASGAMIGLNHTAAAVAMVLAAPILPRMMVYFGLYRLMMGAIALLAFCTIAIPWWESFWWWSLLRIGWGFAGTALFFGSEFWVVTNAPDESRGRIVGAYILVLSGSYMIGPLLLGAVGIDSWLIYLIPTLIILASAVPLVLGRSFVPDPRSDEPVGLFTSLRYFWTDPMVTFGVVLFGVIEFGAMGLIAVWGLRSGFEQETAVAFVFWLAAGSAICQLPVGWAADRYDRRKLLACAAAVSITAPLIIVASSGDAWIVNAAVAIWGGTAVAFYSIALTELGARYAGQAMAQANAAVMLAYGLGALAAPAAFGLAMDIVPPDGLLWLAVAAACGYLALAIVRLRFAPRVPLDSTDGSDR